MDTLISLLKSDPNAANAFGAIASAAAAFLSLIVSTIAIGISVWAVRSQRKHNELSVRPLAEVTVADYENSLRVKLRNSGVGPMIVKKAKVCDGQLTKSSVVEWIPALPTGRPWTTFSQELKDRTLQPGGEIILLELTTYEGEQGFEQCRDLVRSALSKLTVNVEYTDIYNKDMPIRSKSLSWFGRHK